ncbi:3-hydroxyacyl-ACP dehydratase FabZ [Thiohalorhabdus methylotrophus]|uniref:3-hydroxyacyl-[acyl-carrier-protein] dehydratase FabZ n=1 Tax=Thiohalorhabdus methylotrophus TaxID=3242694 RepID=A0ABV4TYS1_9GAMM
MGIEGILRHLPHRYPFLLVDRILDWEPGTRMTAIKNVTFNEPFFEGHFPDFPIMPGVLIVEALVQVGGLLACKSEPEATQDKHVYFMGIDKARFRKPVVPGDQLHMEVSVTKHRGKVWQFDAAAYVDGERVADAQLMATITAD